VIAGLTALLPAEPLPELPPVFPPLCPGNWKFGTLPLPPVLPPPLVPELAAGVLWLLDA
jgi:hypothetical protein